MKSVLVIDDQPEIRELIRLTLEIEDFTVHEAGDGQSGLDSAVTLRPDLVLLDVMMPGGLDGFAVCQRLRGHATLHRTPIVMLTSRSDAADRRRGLEVGASAFLTKPFSPRQLLSVVSRLA
ncbi:MAG: hypothetical protein RLZZ592_1568 [Pseudomonadota bacterium]|jgi:DNA-binding response OmpR family regulator|nr:hypothetical protein [Pseudomonadota bacterium]